MRKPVFVVSIFALTLAVAGLVHGYARGESLVGAEASPLVAYLLGLLIMQTAIGVVVYAAVRSLARWPARTTGLTVAGVLVASAAPFQLCRDPSAVGRCSARSPSCPAPSR